MVNESTRTEECLTEHSVQRNYPIRMQTANGIVELTNEITFDIEKLKQCTTAVVGNDIPDLLSVGYRCQELGYGLDGHLIQFLILFCPMVKLKLIWRSISLFHICLTQAILLFIKRLHRQGAIH